MYLTSEDARNALSSMIRFNNDIEEAFSKNGLPFSDNLGRRNALMSQSQEKYFADQLRKKYPGTLNDGRTGMPDIVIPEIDVTLECKLTSPIAGSVTFRADKECFNKGPKDFLYVIADESFEKFVVLLFKGLKREDFTNDIESSRGKVSMIKSRTFDRVTVLHGKYEIRSLKMIEEINEKMKSLKKGTYKYNQMQKRINSWQASKTASFSFELLHPNT
jgi:hypothetical protein